VVHLTNAHVAGLDDPKVLSRLLWSSKPHELDTTILELDDHPPDAARCPIATRRLLLHTEPSPQTYSSATPAVGTSDALDVRHRLLDVPNPRLSAAYPASPRSRAMTSTSSEARASSHAPPSPRCWARGGAGRVAERSMQPVLPCSTPRPLKYL
jgi:hypothetical protein